MGSYGVRLALSLAHAFHTDPFSAVISALTGGNGSGVQHSEAVGHRVNIMLYGYGGDGHNGAFLTDSIMLVSINPQPGGRPQISEISIPRLLR